MGLFDFFKHKKAEEPEEWENEENWKAEPLSRDKLDVTNAEQREKFVRGCLEQMNEANQEIEKATMEYQLVTDYLTDMEEIEQLPNEERAEINAYARRIISLKKDQNNFQNKTGLLTEVQFRNVEKIEDEMPEGLDKLVADEEYRVLVRQDLQNLEGEKVSSQFRKRELAGKKANARGMSVIVVFAASITILLLLIFQYILLMDTKIGYLITIGLTALAFTMIFLQYSNASMEYGRVVRRLNQLILLQNTVKIRYVNVTNVIDYNYNKYKVNSSNELRYLWEKYQQEKEERQKYEEATGEIEENKEELVTELRRLRIKDPNIWLHQVEALIDAKEMVEIRHGLIIRRQAMRKRIEYNTENRDNAKLEVSSLAKEYPRYAREILALVSEYD